MSAYHFYNKEVKYSDLPASFSFPPIAVETLGPINESAVDFLRNWGAGSPQSSRRSDSLHTCFRGCLYCAAI